ELSITPAESAVSGTIEFDPQALANEFLSSELLNDWVLFNERLQADFRTVFTTDNSGLRLESLSVDLDGAGSTLQLAKNDEAGRALTQLSLPISISLLPNTVNQSFRIQASDLYGTLSLIEADNELYLEASLTELLANCDDFSRCRSRGNFRSQALSFSIAGVQGESLVAEGELEIENLPDLIEIEARNVTTSLGSAQFQDWQTSAQFSIERVFLILGELDRAQVRFRSEELSVASEDIQFTNPAVQGLINYSGGSFAGSLDLALGTAGDFQSPLIQTSFNHSLERDRGNLNLEIAGHEFSVQALSELVQQQLLTADISSGSINGETEIAWTLSADNGWQVEGPASFSLNDISGSIEDTLIIGLNTTATAQVEDWQTLVSDQNLTASIEVVDVGLPINNVQWQYAFDTAVPEITVSELNSDFFGGKVEIADFRLDPTQPEQELTVVLSRLDLESIVDLAGYPEIFVDGLISGYIPLIVREGQILVDEGLVGALQPGGTIRYTPETTATEVVNSSVQLVNDALSNYQYETLDTRVYYDENGDLLLEVELQGINPDMNGGQPINLNVNVTNNIPSLLRSLRAGQVIQDRLEQQLQNR
ncbi:MAG: YdbH domain-containing protein, partial [Pseudomonadales bacterium]|nr:YdbH domain-containing protein [Pseudomonadales bacterium]